MFYKFNSFRFFYILIISTSLCCYGATVADISQDFFGRIDLDRAELSAVKAAYLSGDHASALEGYKNIFIDRMAVLDLGSPEGFWSQGATSQSMAYSGTIKMDAMGTGYCTYTIGTPGNVEWFPLVDCYIDFGRDVSSMHWTGIIIKGYMTGQPVSYLSRFCDYWNDFGVNWMGQRPANGYPYSDTLHWAWKSGLYLAWRVDNFMRFYSAACTYNPAAAKSAISGEKLANILNQLTTLEIPDLAGYRYPATPNQQITAIQGLLKASAALSDFKNVDNWRSFALAKAEEYVTAGNYLADGSDQEQSFGYNAGLIDSAGQMIDLINQIMPSDEYAQEIVTKLAKTKIYRTRFLEMLKSPIGSTPATGKSSMTVPATYTANPYDNFASICYPYGGYAMLRSGWDRNALYAFFKSSRIGYGHYVEDGLHLTLCAYGKNLLISGGPNSYSGEPADIYYSSSFSRNTIAVDGFGQTSRQGNPMPSNGYPDPIDAHWHTSANFDLTEGSYPYGYGDKITDVLHTRQVIHARRFGLFAVTDRLRIGSSHNYTLTWGFDSSFAAGDIHYDSSQKKLYSNKSNEVNLTIQHFTASDLSAQTHYGDSVKWLGWYTPRYGHNTNIAKPDWHIKWSGEGDQQIVSLLYPQNSSGAAMPAISPYNNGFDLTGQNGDQLGYRAALSTQTLTIDNVSVTADMLMLQRIGTEPLRGMVMGAVDKRLLIDGRSRLAGFENFEFTLTGSQLSVTAIRKPEFFKWEGEAAQMQPMYNNSITPAASRAVWWDMNQPASSEFIDASGQGFGATIFGSPIWHDNGGVWGSAIEFDGLGDWAMVGGDYSAPTGNQPRTTAAWVKVAKSGTLVCWGNDAPSGRWRVEITENGTLGIDVDGGMLAATTDLRDGKWHHVAAVLPEINSGWLSDAILYVDGKRESASLLIDYEVSTLLSEQITIGKGGNSFFYGGLLDEVMIAASELSDEQIDRLYRSGCRSLAQPCGDIDFGSPQYRNADLNYDCRVDFEDLWILADYWLKSIPPAADINRDGWTDFGDFTAFSNAWKSVPMLWWPLTELDTDQVNDFGVSGLSGQMIGSPLWTNDTPVSSQAVVFDGVDDCIIAPWFDEVGGKSARTVSMWIKTQDCGYLVSWGDDWGQGQTFSLAVQQEYGLPGTLAVLVSNGYRVGRTDLRDNQWHHIAAVVPDDVSPDVWKTKLYIDGVEEKYSTFRSKPINTTNGSLAVGASIHQGNHFKGAIDDLRIYNKALSPAAIVDIIQE